MKPRKVRAVFTRRRKGRAVEKITFTLTEITPEIAAEMLLHNEGNRKQSRSDIANLAKDMADGRFRLTHQAIAFDKAGNLIDGQHRLQAVVKSGVTVWMYVARYHELATAKALPLDIGRKRTAAQILQEDSRAVQIVSTAWRVTHTSSAKTIERHVLAATIETHAELIADLIQRCKANTKKTPVAVRAGMFLRLVYAARQDSLTAYRHALQEISSYVSSEYDSMSPVVQAFNRQRDNDSWGGQSSDPCMQQCERAARAWIAFDYNKAEMRTIRISSATEELRAALKSIREHIVFPQQAEERDEVSERVEADNRKIREET